MTRCEWLKKEMHSNKIDRYHDGFNDGLVRAWELTQEQLRIIKLVIEEEGFLDHEQLNKVKDIIDEQFGLIIGWNNPKAGLEKF
jgi:hypothetical protein